MPCLDPPEYAGMESVQITQNTTNTTHQQPDVDMCSPFCSCGCCFYAISLQEILFPDFTCPLEAIGIGTALLIIIPYNDHIIF